MKFGLEHINFSYDGQGPQMVESLKKLVSRAESIGFDSFWVMDHFQQVGGVGEPYEPVLESWTTQAVVAGFSSRIKLGTLVTGIIYRHPSVLAKMAATLDVLSKGRLFMGIGAAWNQDEAKAYGIPFPATGERFKRLEEAVQIIRKMWIEERANFGGKFYQIRDAYCNPKPVQKPHPPIMIGGSGERETLRIVAKYADACNLFVSDASVRKKLKVLRNHCRTFGRDYDSILKTKLSHIMIDRDKAGLEKRVAKRFQGAPQERVRETTVYGTPEEIRRQVEALRDAGIEYLIVNLEPDRELEAMDLFASEVLGKL